MSTDYLQVREAVDRAWHVTRAYEEPVRIDIIARCAFDVLHPREVTLDDLTVPEPADSYTVELGGQRFTQAQWEAVQTYIDGPPCSCPDLDIASRSGHVSHCGATR